ncbi:hypothetical protein [Haliea sp. E17]|uniref:hypothetical protein n=1 Tax=Haliea sp. E17 TaxID=3401576 RepID=UPI003AB0A7AC
MTEGTSTGTSLNRWRSSALCIVLALAGGMAAATPAPEATAQRVASHYSLEDTMFSKPFIDIDEWRDTPVRHRYVHGGFADTDTRFSFYLPPKEKYEGRFFQYITPVPESENLSQGKSGEEDKIGFAVDSGAYFVETNGGGKFGAATPGQSIDPTIGAFRANAAAAQYSRAVALEMYGGKRPYGYAFGGSGGAFRTIGGMENTEGVWDGAVPYVAGSPMSIPNVFTVRTYAMRVLADKLPAIADAVDVGSGKDPFTDIGLNAEERDALQEATRLGFPLRGWHAWDHLGLHAFSLLFPAVVAVDTPYFSDFWAKPGYEGYQPTASLKRAQLDFTVAIDKLVGVDEARAMGLEVGHLPGQRHGLADDAWKAMQGKHQAALPVALKIAAVPAQNTLGADLSVASGDAAGTPLPLVRLEGDIVLLAPGAEEALAKLKVGDKLHFDNRNFLAVQTYHRHQVPGPEYAVWDQFRDAQDKPIYPQRPMLLGPMFAQGASGTLQSGDFKGKMILLENLYDTEAFPWQADWYRARVQEHLGEAMDDNFRLWFNDHSNHHDATEQRDPLHTVSYLGVLQQALRDVSAWVEAGVEPPANTRYEVVDGQVEVPEDAALRGGIQPTIALTANGSSRAEVAAGEAVDLVASVAVPAGTGSIVAAQWDLDGQGTFPVAGQIERAADGQVTVRLEHAYSQPGTWFPTLRVASQREGDAGTAFARIQNLGRVRVVVR